MRGALDVHRELLARDVPHEMVRLRGTVAADADDLPRALDHSPTCCVAVRCYVTDQGFACALVGAGAVPHPQALLDALDAGTLRPATPDEVNAATEFSAGLVSPVCLPDTAAVVCDSALLRCDVVYCPLGEGGVALGIRTRDLLAATGARVVGLFPLPLPAGGREHRTGGPRVLDVDAASRARSEPR